jgi:nickel transport protein
MKSCLPVFLALLACGQAHAHDLWLEKTENGFVLAYGHADGDSHGGPLPAVYPADQIRSTSCFDDRGIRLSAEPAATSPIPADDRCAACCVLVSSGYWTKTREGTKNLAKNEVEGPLRSWLSYESVKHIVRWGDALAAPLTEDLEIVPLHDPTVLGPGDKLRLLVTLGGEPVEGAIVLIGGKPRGQTDDQGRVNVKVREEGAQMIQASYREAIESEETDEIVRTATLTFQAGEEE